MKLFPISCFLLVSLGTAFSQDAPSASEPKKEGASPPPMADGPGGAGGPGGGGPRRGGGGGPGNAEEMEAQWKKADADGDGFLTEAEFAQLPRISNLPEDKRAALFKRFDRNGDGKISPDEIRPESGETQWKKADADGDGAISEAEFATIPRFANMPEDKRAAAFKRFDRNGDGKITGDEMPNRGPVFPRFEELDLNKDGKITFDEFQKVPFVARQTEDRQHAMFDRMDRNKDGVLTAEDGPPPGRPGFEGGGGGRGGRRGFDPKRFIQEFDTNNDGALNFEEFRKAPFVKDLGEDSQEAKFNEMDRNHDLKIDAADFPPPPERPEHPGDDDDHPGPHPEKGDSDKPKGP